MFQVKICGVTSVEDAMMIAASGADAIGLNFITGSPRCLDLERATEISQNLPEGIVRIGVFVGRPSSEMLSFAKGFFPWTSLGKNKSMRSQAWKIAKLAIDISGKDISIDNIDGEEFFDKYGHKCPLGVNGRNSDNKLFRSKLNWEVSQPLRDGIEKTYAWIQQQAEK